MGIRDRPTAPRSPWQNGYCERLIGSAGTQVREMAEHAQDSEAQMKSISSQNGDIGTSTTSIRGAATTLWFVPKDHWSKATWSELENGNSLDMQTNC